MQLYRGAHWDTEELRSPHEIPDLVTALEMQFKLKTPSLDAVISKTANRGGDMPAPQGLENLLSKQQYKLILTSFFPGT